MWNDLKRAARIPGSRRRLLWEALIALLIARCAMAFLPFRRIAAWLGTPGAESSGHGDGRGNPLGARGRLGSGRCGAPGAVGWALPCQVLAAMGMLRRRGLEGTVCFGARPE
jgi:hypothetical protein